MSSSKKSQADSAPGARRIETAARRLFARQGYAATSMASIAAAAGVSKATVFHHFGSKQLLYESLVEEAASGFREQLLPLLDGSGDLQQRLQAFAAGHYERLKSKRGTMRLIARELLDITSGSSQPRYAELVAKNFALMVESLHRGQAEGAVRKDADAGLAAFVLLSSGWFLFLTSSMAQKSPGLEVARDTEAYAAELARLLYLGLKPRNGSVEESTP